MAICSILSCFANLSLVSVCATIARFRRVGAAGNTLRNTTATNVGFVVAWRRSNAGTRTRSAPRVTPNRQKKREKRNNRWANLCFCLG